jgi:hypothetical protein
VRGDFWLVTAAAGFTGRVWAVAASVRKKARPSTGRRSRRTIKVKKV